MGSSFTLRFADPSTHARLHSMAEVLGLSMNQLVNTMIERQLAALSIGAEADLEGMLERLRQLTPTDVDRSLDAWAAREALDDPIAARAVAALEDKFSIDEAFQSR